MIDVSFKTDGPGTCAWCQKEKDEVFEVAFSDKSFVGLYCWADIKKAVKMKCEKRAAKPLAASVNGPSIPVAEAKK